jgi:hypothetical protein
MTYAPSPARLLSTVRVKALLIGEEPGYGADFTEAEWEAITERLETLARLVWRVSQRQSSGVQEDQYPTQPPGLGEEDQTAIPGGRGSR